MQRAALDAAPQQPAARPMRGPVLGLAAPPVAAAAPPPDQALAAANAPMLPQTATAALPEPGGAVPALTGETSSDSAQVPALISEEPADPVARLRRLIEEREEETVEILRSWMAEDEEAT